MLRMTSGLQRSGMQSMPYVDSNGILLSKTDPVDLTHPDR